MMKLPGGPGMMVWMIDGAARLDHPPLFDSHSPSPYLFDHQAVARPDMSHFDQKDDRSGAR